MALSIFYAHFNRKTVIRLQISYYLSVNYFVLHVQNCECVVLVQQYTH